MSAEPNSSDWPEDIHRPSDSPLDDIIRRLTSLPPDQRQAILARRPELALRLEQHLQDAAATLPSTSDGGPFQDKELSPRDKPVAAAPLEAEGEQAKECSPAIGATLPAAPGLTASDERTPVQPTAPPLGRIADYDLLAEIGRGGMGVVYRARQRGLNRLVALKMVLAGGLASEAEVQRFHLEAEAAANLRHPGIVAVYEVGESEGRHFYSMEYIEGAGLNELVRQNPLPVETAVRYVRDVALAMHHAHQQGVLHRDLKPSNVLIDSTGAAKVADFGLAKRVDDQSQLTASGAAVGTPSYMPPEQARGDQQQISALSDVYSLGAVLYETITSRPPFRAANVVDTMFQVIHNEPAPPRMLNPKIPRDVETICLKCLEKQPSRRYSSARELAEDLDRFLKEEPIRARRTGVLERAWRWRRRNPALAAALLGLAIALAGGFAGVFWKWREADRQRERALLKSAHLAKASDEMFLVIEDWLERVPEEERVRQQRLESVLKLHEQFLADSPTDPEARRQLAQSHQRVAAVRRLLKQNDLAAKHRRQAIAVFERLAKEFPESPEYRLEAASNTAWLGEALRENNHFQEARSAYERAIAALQHLVNEFPERPEYAAELVRSHLALGLLCAGTDRLDEADLAYRRGIDVANKMLRTAPGNEAVQRQLANCRNNRAMLLKQRERPLEAAKEYQAAVSLYREMATRSPENQDFQFGFATVQKNYANLLLQQRKTQPPISSDPLDEARIAYEQAIGVLKDLTQEYASIPDYQQELAKCLNGLGAVHLIAERHDLAEQAWKEASELLTRLAQQSPKRPEYHSALGMTLGNLAKAARRRNDGKQAQMLLTLAISHQQQALAANPSDREYRAFLKNHRLGLARELAQAGHHAELAKQAEAIAQLVNSEPADLVVVAELYVQARQSALKDESLSDPQKTAAAAVYEQQALESLQLAVRGGMKDRASLAENDALAPLQGNSVFAALLANP